MLITSLTPILRIPYGLKAMFVPYPFSPECVNYCLFTATEIGVEWNAITLNYASWYKNPRLNSDEYCLFATAVSCNMSKISESAIKIPISIYHIISITAQILKERQSIFEGQ